MTFSRLLVFACLFSGGLAVGHGADAISPVDYTQQNSDYAPAATVDLDLSTPQMASTVQDKRVETSTLDKKSSALGDRRAAVEVSGGRGKVVREKNSYRPETHEQVMSAFNHRESTLATGSDTKRPGLVAKYQTSLAAASASNMARFPAASTATTAKINRFVFRKNAPDPGAANVTTPSVVHAAGSLPDVSSVKPGSAVQK